MQLARGFPEEICGIPLPQMPVLYFGLVGEVGSKYTTANHSPKHLLGGHGVLDNVCVSHICSDSYYFYQIKYVHRLNEQFDQSQGHTLLACSSANCKAYSSSHIDVPLSMSATTPFPSSGQ